jgi:hypothetical protein
MDSNKQTDEVEKQESQQAFMRTFSSQEEAELFRLKRDMERSDIEKFHMFCRMIRIGKMLSPAKISVS